MCKAFKTGQVSAEICWLQTIGFWIFQIWGFWYRFNLFININKRKTEQKQPDGSIIEVERLQQISASLSIRTHLIHYISSSSEFFIDKKNRSNKSENDSSIIEINPQ